MRLLMNKPVTNKSTRIGKATCSGVSPEREALIKNILNAYCKHLMNLSNEDLKLMIEKKSLSYVGAAVKQIAWRNKNKNESRPH